MRYFTYFLLSAFCILSSCKFNSALQGRGEQFLQGEWAEDSVPYQDKLLEYTRHQFTFTCDSFYASLQTHSKVNRYPEDCFNNGIWNEYAKGRYAIRKDTLYLIGTFTKENFKQKISGCYRIGQYIPKFLIKKRFQGTIELENVQQHVPFTLKLKKRLICNPKPL